MLSISSFSLCSRFVSSTHSAWAWRQTASRSEASLPCRASIPCRTFGCSIRFGDRGERVLTQNAPWVTIASGSDADDDDENALAGNSPIPVQPISSNSWHDLFSGSGLVFFSLSVRLCGEMGGKIAAGKHCLCFALSDYTCLCCVSVNFIMIF